jgi:hypothetical protein
MHTDIIECCGVSFAQTKSNVWTSRERRLELAFEDGKWKCASALPYRHATRLGPEAAVRATLDDLEALLSHVMANLGQP